MKSGGFGLAFFLVEVSLNGESFPFFDYRGRIAIVLQILKERISPQGVKDAAYLKSESSPLFYQFDAFLGVEVEFLAVA